MSDKKLVKNAQEYLVRPIAVAAATGCRKGKLPMRGNFLSAEGAAVTAVKNCEDGDGIIVRAAEFTGEKKELKLSVPGMKKCYVCRGDEREKKEVPVADGSAVVVLPAYSTATVKIT
ncbi:MAG TPA: hypothetical protein H9708_01230 [Candidatus Borkfalkia stercoripullorum]|nr:hypothetical protein [Candidatus Borkfalkia stercoripullorum]